LLKSPGMIRSRQRRFRHAVPRLSERRTSPHDMRTETALMSRGGNKLINEQRCVDGRSLFIFNIVKQYLIGTVDG